MGNEVRVAVGVDGAKKAASDLDNLKLKFQGLQSGGAKGAISGLVGGAIGGANTLLNLAGGANNLIQDTIKGASDLNETLQKSGVVFGNSADDIKAWGKAAAQSMGLSENAAISAAASIGNLLLSTGTAKEKIAPMSEGIVGLAADLSSFNNIPVDEVLTKLQSGLVGQEKPLRELGVAISAASVDAEAANLGFKKVNGTFTEGEKVQARYSLIFKQTATAQGDFARTSDQLANAQRKVNAEMENSSDNFGNKVLPKVTALENFIANDFLPTAADLSDWLGTALPLALSPLATAMDFVDTTISQTAIDLINTNNIIGAIPGPWHQAADAMTMTGTAAGKAADDVAAVGGGMAGTADSVGKSMDDMIASAKKWQEHFHADTGQILRDSIKVRKQLSSDAQDIIDGYFDPIEKEADRHNIRLQLFADQEALRTAKTKEDSRQARDAIMQDLDDEATSLADLGGQGKLTQKDIDRFTADAKKSFGKIPPEVQLLIDHLRTLAKFPDIDIGFRITPQTPLTKAAVAAGFVGNQDLYKKVGSIFGPHRAAGGPVTGGQAYTVGEKGPETFVPNQSGTIVPNGAGGGSVTVNVYPGIGTSFTPAEGRRLADAILPPLLAGMQRRGIVSRTGTGLTG